MSENTDSGRMLEILTFNPHRKIRPGPITQAQLLAAATLQISVLGTDNRRDITFCCVMCGLPQSFRLWEQVTRLDTDKITQHIGKECVGRHVPSDTAIAKAFIDEVNALGMAKRDNLGSARRPVGCDWACYGMMGDLNLGIDVTLPMETGPKTVASFGFAPMNLTEQLAKILDRRLAPNFA